MAATADQQILQTLKMIENHAKKLSGDSTKMMADNVDDGGSGAFENSNKGLLVAFTELQKTVKANEKIIADANKAHAKHTKANAAANKAINELRESVKDQLAEGKKAATINKNVRESLSDLKNMGVDLGASFATITDQNKGEYLAAIDNAQDSLNDLASAAKRARIQAERENRQRRQEVESSQKKLFADFRKGLLGALGVFTTRASQASIESQASGFQFASGSGGGQGLGGIFDSLSGVVGESVDAFTSGASIEEVQRFAAANRAALTAATQQITGGSSALLTAREGMSAVEEYGDSLRDTFGFRGQSQLNAIGQSLTILTNLGVRPTMDNLNNLAQTIENVAKTSDANAAELFGEFTSLAEDSNFQAFFLALGNQGDVFDRLGDSFLRLQKTVGLNAKEFTAYQKFLADQRTRTGSERQVQGAFVATLADAFGLQDAEAALLQQGASFYESLTLPEQAQFDDLYNQLRLDLTTSRQEATARGDAQAVENIDILMREAGLTELTAIRGRDQSGVTAANQGAQAERVDAAAQQTEELVKFNSQIREYIDGFFKSPFAGLGFFGEMTKAVFQGTLAANMFAGKGGAAAKLLGKAGLVGSAGLIGYEAANALGLPGMIDDLGKAITGDDDYTLGRGIYNAFGGSEPSALEQRVKQIKDETQAKIVEFGDRAEELNQAREQAQTDGNMEMIAKMDEQLAILRQQYDEMIKREEERLLDAKSPRASGRNRKTAGR